MPRNVINNLTNINSAHKYTHVFINGCTILRTGLKKIDSYIGLIFKNYSFNSFFELVAHYRIVKLKWNFKVQLKANANKSTILKTCYNMHLQEIWSNLHFFAKVSRYVLVL